MKRCENKFDPVAIRRLECASGERFTFSDAQSTGEARPEEQNCPRTKDCSSVSKKRTLRPSVASGQSPNDSFVRELLESAKPQAPAPNRVLQVYKSKQSAGPCSPRGDRNFDFELDSREQAFASNPISQQTQTTNASFQDYCRRYYKNTSNSLSKRNQAPTPQNQAGSSSGQNKRSSFISKIIAIHGKLGQEKPQTGALGKQDFEVSSNRSNKSCRVSKSNRSRVDVSQRLAPPGSQRGEAEAVISFKDLSSKNAEPKQTEVSKTLAERVYKMTRQQQAGRSRNSSSFSRRKETPERRVQLQPAKPLSKAKAPNTAREVFGRCTLLENQTAMPNDDPKPAFTHRSRSPLLDVKESLQAVYRRKQPLMSSKAANLSYNPPSAKPGKPSKESLIPSDCMMVNLDRLKRLMMQIRRDKENTPPPEAERLLEGEE